LPQSGKKAGIKQNLETIISPVIYGRENVFGRLAGFSPNFGAMKFDKMK